jgi:ubiquinone/menaquinone biosynthesis C-methylase UbiE
MLTNFRQRRAIFDPWAKYYDLIEGDRTQMAGFYCGLVSDRTRSILDLACGTGTITLALAQRLVERRGSWGTSRIVGADESAEMLRIAQAKDARPEWILGDMRSPPVHGVFDLVTCCYNTVQSLLTEDELAGFFRFARSAIDPGGMFAFDIVQLDLLYVSAHQHEHLAHAFADERGRRLSHLRKYSYDARSQILTINHRIIDKDDKFVGQLGRLDQQYRQYSTAEIEQALVVSGLILRQLYGNFDKSPLSASSKKQIFVCSAS